MSRYRPRQRILSSVAIATAALAISISACGGDPPETDGTSAGNFTPRADATPGASVPPSPERTPDADATPSAEATRSAEATPSGGDAPGGDAFWIPPDPLPAGEPGDIIWQRPATTAAGDATLVLHHSSDVRNEPIAVSTIVYPPAGGDDEPASRSDPTPILALAHGTTGIADECAPSRQAVDGQPGDLELVPQIMEQGWLVVATDYEGLGTPGRHPYLVNRSAAHTVLDSVRAAIRIGEGGVSAESPVVVFGFSQGGGAAAFAADIAATYAPELDVRGIVAAAPATESGTFGSAELTPNRIAFGMMIVAGNLAAYPELDPAAYLTDAGQARLDVVDEGCLFHVFNEITTVDTTGWSNPPDSPGRDAWQAALDDNTPGHVATDIPVLVLHGADDPTVLPASSEAYQRRACDSGGNVDRIVYPAVDHVGVLTRTDAVDEAVAWMRGLIDGDAAPPGCSF